MKYMGIGGLPEMFAENVDERDYLLITDMFVDNNIEYPIAKRISIKELMKYIENYRKPTEWKCLRCNTIVDMVKFCCKCKTSPSPWEPINKSV